ncbi:MAG TPA: helix-turn-helix domain-containing protein [Gemmataceae bacterium]|nr:helix-turn-helix domain-containing protein [Gemmataceae bacterium]
MIEQVEVSERLGRIEADMAQLKALVTQLVEREKVRDWYSTEEAANFLGRAEFTVREWCRLGRVKAEKRMSGRGAHAAWVISHDELQRYQREGLLPFGTARGSASSPCSRPTG